MREKLAHGRREGEVARARRLNANVLRVIIVIAAAFQLFDGMQAVAAGALRGLQDTRIPMWIAAFALLLRARGNLVCTYSDLLPAGGALGAVDEAGVQ